VSARAGRGLAAAAACCLTAGAASSPRPPSFARDIEVGATGRVAVRLDREVYEGARADLGDLRVVDPGDREVPYVIDRADPAGVAEEVRPVLRNRGWGADGSATAVLDFGRRLPKRRLQLRLSGDNFRRRVTVEGGDDRAEWTTLVDEAWVFAVPGAEPLRAETLDLPENDFPRLRVRVRPAPDEERRPSIEDALVPGDGRPPRHEERLEPRWSEAQDGRAGETLLTLDLGARHQPFHAVEIDVEDERFFREVRIDARRDPRAAGEPPRWEDIGRGEVHRLEHEGRRRECLRVAVRGRERTLRVRVRNRDDRPLRVRGVAVHAPVERLLFEAATPGRHRLTYGSDRPAPFYDLARTVADPGAWGEGARSVSLGPPRRLAAAPGDRERPWTERHPALLWVGLIAAVAALGALTHGALRRAGREP
jgi:hypothetical protein